MYLQQVWDYIVLCDEDNLQKFCDDHLDDLNLKIINFLREIYKIKLDGRYFEVFEKLNELKKLNISKENNYFNLIWDYLYLESSLYIDNIEDFSSKLEGISQLVDFIKLEQDERNYWTTNLLRLEGRYYNKRGKYKEAINLLKKAISKFENQNKSIEVIETYNFLGKVYDSLGELDLALDCYEKGIKLQTSINYVCAFAETYNNIGVIYSRKGKAEKAIEAYYNGLNYCSEKNPLAKANILNNIGIFYKRQGMLEDALNYFEQAYILFEELKLNEKLCSTIVNIGNIQLNFGLLDDALISFEKALKKLNPESHARTIGIIFNNMGLVYKFKGELGHAIDCFSTSKDIRIHLGNQIDLGITVNNIGEVQLQKGELDKAEKNFQDSLDIWKKVGDQLEISNSLNNLGIIQYKNGNIKESMKYLKESYQIRKKIPNDLLVSETIYYLITVNLENTGKFLEKYYSEIKKIAGKTDNKIIHARFQILDALKNQTEKKLDSIIQAEEIYKSIIQDQIVDSEITYNAIINLSDLLINELRLYDNHEIINTVDNFIQMVQEKAKIEGQLFLLIEAFLLDYKFKLIQGKITEASTLFFDIEEIAEKNNLLTIKSRIEQEKLKFNNQIIKWISLARGNADFREKIEEAEIIEHLMNVADALKHIQNEN